MQFSFAVSCAPEVGSDRVMVLVITSAYTIGKDVIEVCVPYVVFIDWTPLFELYMARLVNKNGHQKGTRNDEIFNRVLIIF